MRDHLARLVRGRRTPPTVSTGPRRILIVGGRGREHALAWRMLRDRPGSTLWALPDSDGLRMVATVLPIEPQDREGVVAWCAQERPDLVVIGPCVALRWGIVDRLEDLGIATFGPTKAASRIEWSKRHGAEVAFAAGVPAPRTWWFATREEAATFARDAGRPFAVKPDGIFGTSGVVVGTSVEHTLDAIARHGELEAERPDGGGLILQELVRGREVSFHLLCDGTTARFLGAARDAKRLLDGDQGPNTDGMGAYSPVAEVTPALRREIEERFAVPLLAELRRRGTPYTGFLYLGLMLTEDGPRLLELNARLGDPEAQVLLPLLQVDLVSAMEAAVAGRLAAMPWVDPAGAAVTVVLAAEGYPVRGRHRGGMEVLGLEPDVPDTLVFHGGTSRALDRWWVWGERVVAVTGLGNAVADARARAYARAATITFDGEQHRTDIAAGA